MTAEEAVTQSKQALATACCLLGPQHLVHVRARHLVVNALQAAAAAGLASTDDLVLLVKVCVY